MSLGVGAPPLFAVDRRGAACCGRQQDNAALGRTTTARCTHSFPPYRRRLPLYSEGNSDIDRAAWVAEPRRAPDCLLAFAPVRREEHSPSPPRLRGLSPDPRTAVNVRRW